MHLVDGIRRRHVITTAISVAVLIRVGYAVLGVKEVGELHAVFRLFAQPQHDVRALHRCHGVGAADGRRCFASVHLGIVAHACQLNAGLVDETHRTAIHELWNKVVGNVSAVHFWIRTLAQLVHHVLHNVLHLDEAPYLIKVANILHLQFPHAFLQFVTLLQLHPFFHDGFVALCLFHHEVVLRKALELSHATKESVV